MAETEYIGTGRRKPAVARVRLASGSGKVTINGRPLENYFVVETQRMHLLQPLVATDSLTKYDIRINLVGGGPNGQAGAGRHGIARALLKADANLRPTLKAQ